MCVKNREIKEILIMNRKLERDEKDANLDLPLFCKNVFSFLWSFIGDISYSGLNP